MDIFYVDRKEAKLKREKVYGEKLVEWLYTTKSGHFFNALLIKRPLSFFAGLWYSTSRSAKKIDDFVKTFSIKMEEFEEKSYSSFNDFFIRKFKDSARSFSREQRSLGAFCEARYFAYSSVDEHTKFPVKSEYLSAKDLVVNDEFFQLFENGPLLLARLCPVDYHRFHFPLDGVVLKQYRIPGKYHSVNPIALKKYPRCLIENERQVTIFESEHFGKMAMIEVGAICVGRIKQTYKSDNFFKGDEKGLFLFGGSTVILLGERGKWLPSDDLLKNTEIGLETLVRLGEEVGVANDGH